MTADQTMVTPTPVAWHDALGLNEVSTQEQQPSANVRRRCHTPPRLGACEHAGQDGADDTADDRAHRTRQTQSSAPSRLLEAANAPTDRSRLKR